MNFLIYPIAQNLPKRQAENRGVIRQGVVEKNSTMSERGLAGFPAYVTREENNQVRFYIFRVLDKNVPWYIGPFMGLSEEILS